MDNVACWVRHYHAPGKRGGYSRPVASGEESSLHPLRDSNEAPGHVFPGVGGPVDLGDPIITGVGTAAGLPPHAVGNVTLFGHMLHNYFGGQTWPQCPKPVPLYGLGAAPTGCNQVYRLPVEVNGTIVVRSRGTGENMADALNNRLGPVLFDLLDANMIKHMRGTPMMKCPSGL